MSFESFQFKYNPPPTVSPVIPANQAIQPSVLFTSDEPDVNKSAASQLIVRLSDLLDTNHYLQQAILARSIGLGIEFDPQVDPDTARALQTLYPNLPVPTSLTVSMYNNLLDGEMTAMQIESGLGLNTPYEVNPFQVGATSQVNQVIEDGLLSSGQFQHTLPVLLRQLKGDVVVMINMTAQLSKYPAITVPTQLNVSTNNTNLLSVRGQDISHQLASMLNEALDQQQSIYASIYQVTASVGVVAQDVNNVLITYFAEPASNLIRMIGFMLRQVAFADANARTVIKGVKGTFTNQTGPLKGCSMAYLSGLPQSVNAKKPDAPVPYGCSKGLMNVASHLDWAMEEANKKMANMQESFQKVIHRRMGDTASQTELIASLQAINTMTQLAQAVMSFNGSKPAVGATSTISQTAVVGQILSGMTSTTGTSFVVSNGQMQAVLPSIPAAPVNVQQVLTNGGLNLIVASSTTVKSPVIGAVN